MNKKSNIARLAGAVGVVAILAVGALFLTPQSTVSASAQVSQTKTKVQQMSTTEVAELSARFRQNLLQRLDEASSAKDLRRLSAAEFQDVTKFDPAVKLPSIKIKSFVAFTAKNGDQVIIAVDANDRPVFVFVNTGTGWTAPGPANEPTTVSPPPGVYDETPPSSDKLR